MIIDNSCIVDDGVYAMNLSSFCGADDVFGRRSNVEAADRFGIDSPYWVTSVQMDFLTLYGIKPDQACVGFYGNAPARCEPAEAAFCIQTVDGASFGWVEYEDIHGSYEGRRLTIDFATPCRLAAGEWYLAVQPIGQSDAAGIVAALYGADDCFQTGSPIWRRAGEETACCEGLDAIPWNCDHSFEPPTLSMRVEGVPTGDCLGSERVTAKCKAHGGGEFNVVVRFRNGQPNGTVTALLDPPDPRSMSIPLDDRGRGKGKFKNVPLGEHRVFVCDSIVDVTCAP
ncbi:MAG: hypothetical protein IT449_14540 [Phycisphaerales bacterium]|nr:hypothetical protein [Phycisphaerales bacterium]